MVLDTKSTKFKNSNLNKLIYVVLSLALCIGIAVNGVSIASFLSVFGETAFNYKQTIYDMNKFKSMFSNDVDTLVVDINKYTYDKIVESKKDSICNTAFENYKKAKAFAKEHPNSDSDDYYADYEKYNIIENDEMELQYYESFNIYGDAITVEFYIGFDVSDSDAKGEIERIYKNDISYKLHYSKTENTLGREEFTVLQYYAEDEYGNIVTNIDKKDVSKFKKEFNKNSAEYKSGNYTYFSNINNTIDGSKYLTDAYSTYGEYIKLVDGASVYVRINNNFAGGDRYSRLYCDYAVALPDYNFKNMIVFEVIMLVLLLTLFILSCTAAGHTSDGEVKTAKIDKMPNLLHFVLFAGCTFGLVCLGVYLIDEHINYLEYGDGHYRDVGFYPSGIVKFAMSALASGLYLVFLEFFTSQSRQIKTHNNLFKNTLLYKFAIKLKLLLQYSPVNFKKRLLFLIIGYAVINIALAVGVFLSFGMEVYVVGVLFLLLMLALDAVCAVFAVRYIIQLDKIISAADNRKVPQVEFNKLPQSLKTLTLALSYTKQELDNAVQKAIRDERMKTELITNVSHDLKTPLTSIINYVDLLSKCNIENQEAK